MYWTLQDIVSTKNRLEREYPHVQWSFRWRCNDNTKAAYDKRSGGALANPHLAGIPVLVDNAIASADLVLDACMYGVWVNPLIPRAVTVDGVDYAYYPTVALPWYTFPLEIVHGKPIWNHLGECPVEQHVYEKCVPRYYRYGTMFVIDVLMSGYPMPTRERRVFVPQEFIINDAHCVLWERTQ